MSGQSTSGSPTATTNQQGSPGVLTPPRQAPGTEASTGNGAAGGRGSAGGARGGRAGQNAAAGGGAGGTDAQQPSPHQAELMRKSERIDHTVMRSICVGCGDGRSSSKSSARKEAPARVDVQAPLRQ